VLLSGIRRISRVWNRLGSGILVPDGYSSGSSRTSNETYLHIKEKALEVEQLYADVGVTVPKRSGLAVLIQAAKDLSDNWLATPDKSSVDSVLLNAAHLSRVSDAAIAARAEREAKKYLTLLASGSLDLLQRDRSEAKDILWELELLSILRSHGLKAALQEPPDIVVDFDGKPLAIACKKAYSERNIGKVLSEGVAQIERRYDFGVVAVNIDDLIPASVLFRQPDHESLGRAINSLNVEFLSRNERHFRRYLGAHRLISALVSTGGLADVTSGPTRLNNARQSTVWTVPGASGDQQNVYRTFEKALNS
jgi:hypothetical protein